MNSSIQTDIQAKLNQTFDPVYLKIINESHQHTVPKDSETHFKVILVSERFRSQTRVQRQRAVYHTLAAWLTHPIHALSLKLFDPKEWHDNPEFPHSPHCLGGSFKEKNNHMTEIGEKDNLF